MGTNVLQKAREVQKYEQKLFTVKQIKMMFEMVVFLPSQQEIRTINFQEK